MKKTLFLFHLLILSGIALKSQARAQSTSLLPSIPHFFVNTSGNAVLNLEIIEIIDNLTIETKELLGNTDPKEIRQAIRMCKDALSELLTEVSWIHRRQLTEQITKKMLSIALFPSNVRYINGISAAYLSKFRKIAIVYTPGLLAADYKASLRNELFSHLTLMSNERCGIKLDDRDLDRMGFPFLKKTGEIDKVLMQRMQKSIDKGVQSIKAMQELWGKRKRKGLSERERKFLHQFSVALKSYKPKTRYENISTETIRELVHNKKILKQGNFIQSGPEATTPAPFYGYLRDNLLIYQYSLHSQSVKGKVNAFFADFNEILADVNDPHGPYSQSKEIQLSELGSFIAQLPDQIIELFFNGFQNLFKEYLLRCTVLKK